MQESLYCREGTEFRSFVSKILSLQHHLHAHYHTDRQLRDRLLKAVLIPHINATLRDSPHEAKQTINRFAYMLSSDKRNPGSAAAHISEYDTSWSDSEDAMECYTLRQSYGGNGSDMVRNMGDREDGRLIRDSGCNPRHNESSNTGNAAPVPPGL